MQLLFLNTRPLERQQTLTNYLRSNQVQVLSLPLLELVALPQNSIISNAMDEIQLAKIVVCVSPLAVDLGMQYLQQQSKNQIKPKNLTWVAVGRSTAERLANYGVYAEFPEHENTEGMLNMVAIRQLAEGDRVIFWRGVGGRNTMINTLKSRQMNVVDLALYKRQVPTSLVDDFYQIKSKLSLQNTVILISSLAAWENFKLIIFDIKALKINVYYMVLGHRVAAVMQQWALINQMQIKTIIIDDLAQSKILRQLQHVAK